MRAGFRIPGFNIANRAHATRGAGKATKAASKVQAERASSAKPKMNIGAVRNLFTRKGSSATHTAAPVPVKTTQPPAVQTNQPAVSQQEHLFQQKVSASREVNIPKEDSFENTIKALQPSESEMEKLAKAYSYAKAHPQSPLAMALAKSNADSAINIGIHAKLDSESIVDSVMPTLERALKRQPESLKENLLDAALTAVMENEGFGYRKTKLGSEDRKELLDRIIDLQLDFLSSETEKLAADIPQSQVTSRKPPAQTAFEERPSRMQKPHGNGFQPQVSQQQLDEAIETVNDEKSIHLTEGEIKELKSGKSLDDVIFASFEEEMLEHDINSLLNDPEKGKMNFSEFLEKMGQDSQRLNSKLSKKDTQAAKSEDAFKRFSSEISVDSN